MSSKIVVLGASGHSKVISDIIVKTGNALIGFLDDNEELIGKTILSYENKDYKVLGKINTASEMQKNDSDLKFIIAIGNNETRKEIAQKYKLSYTTLIHPSANISIATNIDEGTVVMANATINAGSTIGKHCIVNTGAIVEHDNIIEDYVHISPNATLCGTIKVTSLTHIGASATIKNNTNILETCTIGAGAVVVKDIIKKGIYAGVPAKRIK